MVGRQAQAEMNAAINAKQLDGDDIEACQRFYQAAELRIWSELEKIEATADETADVETETETADTESN